MGNKYIDVSATYNGDGTSSAQAGSAGAAGAWNSLANCLNGAPGYGSISNGDDIFIRTKNGSNLGETYSTGNITTAARTAASQVRWIFDDGTVWAGSSGVFTLTLGTTATGRTWTLNDYNSVSAVENNFVLDIPYTGTIVTCMTVGACTLRGMTVLTNHNSGTAGVAITQVTTGSAAPGTTWERCLFDTGRLYSNTPLFSQSNYGCKHTFIECVFDITGANDGSTADIFLFGLGAYGSEIEVIGGRVIGSTVYQRLVKLAGVGNQAMFRADHFDPGSLLLDPVPALFFADNAQAQAFDLSNCGGPFRMTYNCGACRIDWRDGENYPYGNAVLPNSTNTPWSYKVFSRASPARPATLFTLGEIYKPAAATKTVTVNLLINDNLSSPRNDEWWAVVSYTQDSDGVRVSQTTRAASALTTASGVWNSTVYGAQNYSEFKIALTTATAIKQDTEVLVTLLCSRPSGAATNFYFVDPEIVIS